MTKLIVSISALLATSSCNAFVFPATKNGVNMNHVESTTTCMFSAPSDSTNMDRRQMIQSTVAAAAAALVTMPSVASAVKMTGPDDGLLADLPPEAVRSYLQYRVGLQISADYYLWDLQDKIQDTNDWGEVGQIFQVNNNRGQGQPNRVEREFTNPMRILGLSMPPDIADELRDSQFAFEKAMAGITKATAGIRRDLPVEIDKSAVPKAMQGWEDGRVAINGFFKTLNEATGLNELKPIPPYGPNQNKEYGRSERRYLELAKKTKLCQNRGGPALSQAWGGLMVTGYLQDSCGIPDLQDYFYQ